MPGNKRSLIMTIDLRCRMVVGRADTAASKGQEVSTNHRA